MFLVMITTVDN